MNKTILFVLAICFTLPACGGGTDLSSLMARVDASERRATEAEARATRAEELRDAALAGTDHATTPTSGGEATVTASTSATTTAPTSSAPGFTPVMSCDNIDSASMFGSGMITFSQAYLEGIQPWNRASGGINETLVMNISGYDVELFIDGRMVHVSEGPGVYPTGNIMYNGNECAAPVFRSNVRYVINTADMPGRADSSRAHSYSYRCLDTAGGTVGSAATPYHNGTLYFTGYTPYGPTITIAPGSC